jgi:hypothetical protein
VIRYHAARKVVEQLLHGSIVRMPVNEVILDMAARMIMNAVDYGRAASAVREGCLAEKAGPD